MREILSEKGHLKMTVNILKNSEEMSVCSKLFAIWYRFVIVVYFRCDESSIDGLVGVNKKFEYRVVLNDTLDMLGWNISHHYGCWYHLQYYNICSTPSFSPLILFKILFQEPIVAATYQYPWVLHCISSLRRFTATLGSSPLVALLL